MPGRRRLGLGALVAVSLPVLIGGSCYTIEPTYTGNLSGRKVAIIGDSITNQAITELHAALDPTFQVRISAAAGQTYMSMAHDADLIAPSNPDIVMLNLGSNESSALLGAEFTTVRTAAEIIGDMKAMADKFPAACLVLVTINQNVPSPDYRNDVAAALNAAIRARTTHVADWAPVVALDEPGLVANGLHPTDLGRPVLVGLERQAIATCP